METVSNETGVVNLLKRRSVNFPKLLKDYIDKKFFLGYKKFIYFIKNL